MIDSGDSGKTEKNYCVLWERVFFFYKAKISLLFPQTLSIFLRMNGCGLRKVIPHSHSYTDASFFSTLFVFLYRQFHRLEEVFSLPT